MISRGLSGLRIRLVFLVLLAVVPALVLALTTGLKLRRQATAEAHGDALRMVRLASANQEQTIQDVRQLLSTIADLPEVRDPAGSGCAERLAELLQQNHRYSSFSVISLLGYCECAAPPWTQPVNYWRHASFQRAVQEGDFAVGDYRGSRESGRSTLEFAYPVRNNSGVVQSVVVAEIDLVWLSELASHLQLPTGSTMKLVDHHGTVLARYPNAREWVGRNASEDEIVRTILHGRGAGTTRARGLDGQSRLYAFMPLAGRVYPSMAYIIVGIPAKTAYAQADWVLWRNLMALAMVAVLALAAAWFGAGPLILRRLRALMVTARRVADGDLAARTQLGGGPDEISQVAEAFDRMAVSLEQRDADRMAVVRDLKQSEQRLRDLFENSPDAILVEDLQGTVLDVNATACRLHGLPREELIGKSVRDLVPPEHREEMARAFPRLARGESNHLESHVLGPGGHTVPVSMTCGRVDYLGQPSLLVHVRDIGERMRVERALRDSETRYRLLFEHNPQPLFVYDRETLRFLAVNEAAVRHYGYRREEFLAMRLPEIYAEGQLRSDGENHAGGEGAGVILGRHRRKDGSLLDVEMVLHGLNYGGRRAEVVLANDVTERMRAEEALRESNRLLEEALAQLQRTQQKIIQQERLRALGQVASGIAHDFNNSLASILGFTELLLLRPESLEDRDETFRYLTIVHTAAKDAANVVSRLREFYRNREQTDVFLPLDLNRVVNEVISLTQPKWKDQALAEGVSIRIQADLDPVPRIAGDEGDLREALTNLVFNAVDAMIPLKREGTLTFRTRSQGTRVVLESIDTGTGMSEEVRRHCLEPFFSTKGESGTGLGLSVVYGVVKRHGGTIDIASEPDRGTVFTIAFPAESEGASAVPMPRPDTLPKALRILIVDDEPLVREIQAEYLTGDGHAVELASNGQDALKKLNAGTFDLVMTDRGMSPMSGDQLAAAIKQMTPQLPVILLTGFGAMMNAVGERPAGVDAVLCKPLSLTELRAAIITVTARPPASAQTIYAA